MMVLTHEKRARLREAGDELAPPSPAVARRPVPSTLLRRFRIHGFLGSGAEGSVYLAEDRAQKGGRLSLKILDRPTSRSQPLLRMRLSDLARIDHPNIARVLDFEVDRDRECAWIAREYVPGEDLGRFAARTADSVGEVLPRLLESVARALVQFHDRDLVHGDIRPANILCSRTTEGPMLKLIDGGTSLLPREASPAQLQQLRRQDLRFVGAAFYTALTGKTANRGIAPRLFNPAIPLWINRLILRLLIPYSTEGVGSADLFLEEILRQSRTLSRGQRLDITLSRPPVVGRTRELSRLREGIDRAIAGRERPGVLVISGDASTGKTALLREAQVYSKARGAHFLAARAPAGDGLPYEPLLQITQSIAALYGWRDPFDAPRSKSPAELIGAASRMLTRAAERRPCVIAIDDAQSIVPLAGDVIRGTMEEVNSGASSSRILFLISTRGSEQDRRWSEGLRSVPCDPIPLGGLPLEAAGSLLRLAIGLPPDERLVRRLHALTEGKPGLLLASLGVLLPRFRREGAAVTVSSLDSLPLPRETETAARSLVARLSPAHLRAARSLSVHPGFLKESVCRDVLKGVDADDSLRSLAAGGVLRKVSLHTYEWASGALRRELHARLGRQRREQAHAAFARAGRRGMRPGTLTFHLFQAYHLARTERSERASQHALAAAKLLSGVFRYGEAVDYYELSLRLLPPDASSTAARILTALQSACRKGGFPRKGKKVSLELLRRRRSLSQYASAAHFVRLVDGPSAAIRIIDSALRSPCRTSPGSLALLHSKRASALALVGKHRSAHRAAERAETYLSECRNAAIAADVYLDIGSLRFHQGDLARATDYYLTALRLTRKARDAAREAALCDNISLTLRSQLRLPGAMRYARRALAIKLRRGLLVEAAVSRMVLGALLDDVGEHDAGKAEIQKAREVFRSRGDTLRQAWATFGMGSIYLALEEHPDAIEWFNRTLEEAPGDARNGLALAAYAGKIQTFLSTGDLEKAESCLRAGSAHLHEGIGFEARLAWTRARVLYETALGRPAEARRLLREADRELDRSEAKTYRFQFRLLALMLDVAGGASPEVAGRVEDLIADLEHSGLRTLLCEALLLGSEAQLLAGNPRRARLLLGRVQPLLRLQAQPSFRIRSELLRSRLEAATGERIRACLEAFRLASKHELRPLRQAAALQLARSYEAREDYTSAIRYYQEAGEYAGNRSA